MKRSDFAYYFVGSACYSSKGPGLHWSCRDVELMDSSPVNYICFSTRVDEGLDAFFVVIDKLCDACQRGYK